MQRTITFNILFCFSLIAVVNSSETTAKDHLTPTSGVNGRWYSQEQVERGDPLYQSNCAVCHKPDASGTTDWRRRDENGKLPPPPLNGSAHTWHHPLSVLRRTVRIGGIPLGGSMPGFGSKLNAQQIDDIIAWVQSHWSDQIYQTWLERDSMARKSANKLK